MNVVFRKLKNNFNRLYKRVRESFLWVIYKHERAKDLNITGTLRLPDFVSLGGKKCGSTWTIKNLERHPNIHLPNDGTKHFALHFFDYRSHRALAEYANHFIKAGTELKTGENCPAYATMSDTKLNRMIESLPRTKFYLIIRNPIQRAWSHARMNYFDELQNNPHLELNEDEYFHVHFKLKRSVIFGSYSKIIERFSRLENEGRFKVFHFEDITKSPVEFMESLSAYLELPTEDWKSIIQSSSDNTGVKLEFKNEYQSQLATIYNEEIQFLSKTFPDRKELWKTHF